MKSYSNCYNAGEISIDHPNLLSSRLCLSHKNQSINNLKDCGDFAVEIKQYNSSNCQDDTTQPKNVISWSQLEKKRLFETFHQIDFTEIQVKKKTSKD